MILRFDLTVCRKRGSVTMHPRILPNVPYTQPQAYAQGMPPFSRVRFRVHHQFPSHRLPRDRAVRLSIVGIIIPRFARAHVLPDSLDVKVLLAPRTDFRVPSYRDGDAKFFGAAASVLGNAFGIELLVTIRTFFDLIAVNGK